MSAPGPYEAACDENSALLARVLHTHAETALVRVDCLLARKLHEAEAHEKAGLRVALAAVQTLLDEHRAVAPAP